MSGIVQVEADAFAQALKVVSPGVPRIPTLAVLSGVRITVTDGRMVVRASSIDTTVTTSIPASGDLDCVVTHRVLEQVVAKCHGKIGVGLVDGELVAETAKADVRLRTLKLEDWPNLPEPDGDTTELTEEQVAALNRVAYAASTDAARPNITGVKLDGEGAAATDSYRLAWARVPFDCDVLVPASALRSVIEPGKPVTVHADDSHAAFTVEEATTIVRLLQADTYPKYQGLWRAVSPITLTVESKAFLEAIDFVAPVSRDDAKKAKVVGLSVVDGELVVGGRHQDVGEARARCSADGDLGYTIEFNERHLREMIAAVGTDAVTFGFDESPLKQMQVDAGDTVHVVMPVRVAAKP